MPATFQINDVQQPATVAPRDVNRWNPEQLDNIEAAARAAAGASRETNEHARELADRRMRVRSRLNIARQNLESLGGSFVGRNAEKVAGSREAQIVGQLEVEMARLDRDVRQAEAERDETYARFVVASRLAESCRRFAEERGLVWTDPTVVRAGFPVQLPGIVGV